MKTLTFWHTVAMRHCGTVSLWHWGTVALWHRGIGALWHVLIGKTAIPGISLSHSYLPTIACSQLAKLEERVISDTGWPSQPKANRGDLIFLLTILTFSLPHLKFVNGTPRDFWPLRHWLEFWQLRTWIHDNLCDLTIKSDTGQHSQFLRCS